MYGVTSRSSSEKNFPILMAGINKCHGEFEDTKQVVKYFQETQLLISAKCSLPSPLYFQFQIHSTNPTKEMWKRVPLQFLLPSLITEKLANFIFAVYSRLDKLSKETTLANAVFGGFYRSQG